jgi:hypothetical protein
MAFPRFANTCLYLDKFKNIQFFWYSDLTCLINSEWVFHLS